MFLFRDNPDHEVLIESTGRWKRLIDLRDIYEYRDLLRIMIYRAIRARYAQSALGLSWAVIQPFFTMIVFTIIFGRLVRVDSDGAPYALFSFAALVPWTYFQESLTDSVSCLIVEQNTITKSYFPRIILPASRIGAIRGFSDCRPAIGRNAGLVWHAAHPGNFCSAGPGTHPHACGRRHGISFWRYGRPIPGYQLRDGLCDPPIDVFGSGSLSRQHGARKFAALLFAESDGRSGGRISIRLAGHPADALGSDPARRRNRCAPLYFWHSIFPQQRADLRGCRMMPPAGV